MKIVQIVPYIGDEASGPAYSVYELCRAMARRGDCVELWSLTDGQRPSEPHFRHRVFPQASALSRLRRSPAMLAALRSEAADLDVIHSHSLWEMPSVYPGWVAPGNRARLVVSPRGTLSDWAMSRSQFRKRLVWLLLQGRTVRAASCLHATAEHEYLDIRRRGLRQPVCVIPNGIDVPPVGNRVRPSEPRRTVLYLGRLHPTKGVELLLRAWSAVASERADWDLRIVGPEEDPRYSATLRALAASLPAPRVRFMGPVYGPAKLSEYRAAELYVLPTRSENFGMTVAEALAAGTPVITTRGAPWEGLLAERCGWWIEHDLDALVEALRTATGLAEKDLSAMGERGREWMLRDYAWDNIAGRMREVYAWLRNGGPTPATVRAD